MQIRVLHLLHKTKGFNNTVVSAWSNVIISKINSGIVDAELDVVLIICNGVLIHLEIKSYTAQLKELDARISVLQNTTSNLAEMCIVAPLYTDFIDEKWIKQILKFKEKVENTKRMTFIPFTLPNQDNYAYLNDEKILVPHFEDALETVMKKYIP